MFLKENLERGLFSFFHFCPRFLNIYTTDLLHFYGNKQLISTQHIFMKMCQTINTIIKNIMPIIKTRQRNFTDIVSSNFVEFALNVFHSMSYQTPIKQHINIFFMPHSFNILLTPFAFLIPSPSTGTK